MKVSIAASHGLLVEVEEDTRRMTPDGVDTFLRQVNDLYARTLKADIDAGLLDTEALYEEPEVETELEPGE